MEVGQRVQARVLDVAKADGIVDLTLRTHLLQVKEPEPSSAKKEKNKLKVVHCHSSSGMAALACSRFIQGLSCAVVFCLNYLVNLAVQKVYLLSCLLFFHFPCSCFPDCFVWSFIFWEWTQVQTKRTVSG